MDKKEMMRIFEETAYVHTGGSPEELRCAEFLIGRCRAMGLEARLESFPVQTAEIRRAALRADGEEIPCTGYRCAGSARIEAPLYYLSGDDPVSLAACRGKIVLVDGHVGYWKYQDLLSNGALAFITCDGDVNAPHFDVEQRELRAHFGRDGKLPGVNINVKSAFDLVRKAPGSVELLLEQEEGEGQSRNVVLEMPGEIPEALVFTAHYDSSPLSIGAYDNMSGSVGLLALAGHFAARPHRHSLRFVWCGSEERGLLGSKAYAAAHEAELERFVLNINLDMIGSVLGRFIACCTSEEGLVHYIRYLGAELGFGVSARQGVYSSDSTSFADRGVPAVSFARNAPKGAGTIHNRYDTAALLLAEHLEQDIAFITAFAERMADARQCPVSRQIPENMRQELDYYLVRKRRK